MRRDLGYSDDGDGAITGLKVDTFVPAGHHDIRRDAPSGPLPMEMVALGVREEPAHATDAATHRWGGALLRRRAGAVA